MTKEEERNRGSIVNFEYTSYEILPDRDKQTKEIADVLLILNILSMNLPRLIIAPWLYKVSAL